MSHGNFSAARKSGATKYEGKACACGNVVRFTTTKGCVICTGWGGPIHKAWAEKRANSTPAVEIARATPCAS